MATISAVLGKYELAVLSGRGDAAGQRRLVVWWAERLGSRRIADVDAVALGRARQVLLVARVGRDGLVGRARTAATVNRYMALLYGAMRWWARQGGGQGWVPSLPRLPEPAGRVRYLEAAEVPALLAACAAGPAYLRDLVALALMTGMRRGELLGLRWGDVDVGRRRIVLKCTKNGEARAVGLAAAAVRLLQRRRRRAGAGGAEGLVFERTGAVWRAFQAAVGAAGIEDFRFHDLRHTTASWLAMEGRSAIEIADVLGHKTLAMVKRYAHLAPSHSGKLLDAMVGVYMPGEVPARAGRKSRGGIG